MKNKRFSSRERQEWFNTVEAGWSTIPTFLRSQGITGSIDSRETYLRLYAVLYKLGSDMNRKAYTYEGKNVFSTVFQTDFLLKHKKEIFNFLRGKVKFS